ncbi:MAG: DctP family TRAP transporter solute-binding subunit [Thermicanus sp.]|nr:DctP family TRAP transporter solute-binding subunit [Thermicanus sp.]
MRSFLPTFLFLLIGILSALYLGFGFPYFTPYAADPEQAGLKGQILIRFSHVVAENTPKGRAARLFADLVYERSGGRIKVEVFPNGSLYTDAVEIEELKKGHVEMIAPASANLSGPYPKWGILDLPYLFPDYEALDQALSGPLGQKLLKTMEKENMVGLAFWHNGLKQVTNNVRPLILPEDFKGLHFRIMPSPVIASQFSLFGVKTTGAPFNQVYLLLKSSRLDGEENTISNIYTKRFYTVQKYMTLSNHGYLGYPVFINRSFWERLSKGDQEIIREAMAEATAFQHRLAEQMNQDQLEEIKRSAIAIHVQTPEERAIWAKRLEPLYDEVKRSLGKEWAAEIEKLRGK